MGFFAEFGQFLASHKTLWLAPLIILAVLVMLLIISTANSTIAPFVYTLF